MVAVGFGGYFIFRKKDDKSSENSSNLGEQQNQQTQNAVLQLASNLLGNDDNLNKLTKKSGGAAKSIQEIEEEFLISAFQPGQLPVGGIGGGLSSEVIERIWWELRPWIEEYLQDLNRSILEHAREKFRRDVENWLRWQQREYNRQLEEYQRRLQELKKIEDLIAWYQKVREEELLDKISRKSELTRKGYIDRDIEWLKKWDLLDQEIPDLNDEKRIGVTNILWTQGGEIGGSSDLIIFLKPKSGKNPRVEGNIDQNNSETVINFSVEVYYEDKEGYKQFIRDFLNQNGKSNHDAYVLIRDDNSMKGPSAGIAYYLALYSLINQTPLPRNLGSTGTVFERPKVGGIGGLNLKLEYNVNKKDTEKHLTPINIFILCEANRNKETCAKLNSGRSYKENPGSYYDLVSSQIKEQIKQVHFISEVDQIEIALNEILKGTIKEKVHVCGKDKVPEKKPEKPEPRGPPEKPEQPNNPEITPEQLLSLITELSVREKGGLGEHQESWEKLKNAIISEKTHKYEMAVWGGTKGSINLHEEYLEKLEKLKTDSNQQNPNQGKKTRNFIACFDGKMLKEEEVKENDKMICEDCHQQFEEGYTTFGTLGEENKKWWCPKCVPDSVKREIKVKEEREESKDQNISPEELEKQKNQLFQEYQQKFQKIASSVANLTSEILTNLEKSGYTLAKIAWISELHAPSLTAELSVSFSLLKK